MNGRDFDFLFSVLQHGVATATAFSMCRMCATTRSNARLQPSTARPTRISLAARIARRAAMANCRLANWPTVHTPTTLPPAACSSPTVRREASTQHSACVWRRRGLVRRRTMRQRCKARCRSAPRCWRVCWRRVLRVCSALGGTCGGEKRAIGSRIGAWRSLSRATRSRTRIASRRATRRRAAGRIPSAGCRLTAIKLKRCFIDFF